MTVRADRGQRYARVVVVVLLAVACCVAWSPDATAYWSATSVRPGSGASSVGALERPGAPSAGVSGSTVVLGWSASTRADGVPVPGYSVQRYDGQGTAQPVATGSCAGTVTGTACSDTSVPDGTWRYAITPRLASWSGPQSPTAVPVLVDTTSPTLASPQSTAVGGSSYQSGSTVWFRGAAGGSLLLTSAVGDTGSGPAGAATTALTGTTAGWTHAPGLVSTPAGGPYVSNPFAWAPGTTGSVSTTVTGYDKTGNASVARRVDLVDDSSAPTGATLGYPVGPSSTTTVTLTFGAATDAGSGVASRTLYERTATLSGNTCGTFTAWSVVQAVSTASLTRPVAYATCYDYSYVVTDNVGNTATAASPGIVKNRSYPAVVLATAGRLDYYRLDETGSSTVTDSATDTSTNNGTCSGGVSPGQPGAITGDPDTAFAFDGVDDVCSVSRSVEGSFSIELWFKAAGAGSGTTTAWANGAGLVGAEVRTSASDFGVSLLQNGRVCAGTGLSFSICTTDTYLSGWHHVVFTRDRSTGGMVLYVDGASRASGTGLTGLFNGSTTIRMGGLRSSGPFFKGSLDEVALYTSVLPEATVAQHYQTGTG